MKKVEKHFPATTIFALSARTKKGVSQWLNVEMIRSDVGQKNTRVDYDKYAEGEAILGWLNATVNLKGNSIDWKVYATDLLKKWDIGMAVWRHRWDT